MIRLREGDIVVGQAVPWPVFDRDRNLLLRSGHVVDSATRLREVSRRGLYRAAGLSGRAQAGASTEGTAADAVDDAWRSVPFKDLKLPLATRLTLRKLDPDDDSKYTAELLGILKDVSLIIGIPAPDGRLAMFRQGQPLLLRAFTGTRIFAFTGSVLAVRYAPGAYLHLECPKMVDGTEVRARQRVKVKLIASATCGPEAAGSEHGRPAQVEDLSVGGARLIVGFALGEVGAELGLAFRLKAASGMATLKLRAVIRTIDPATEGGEFVYGVQFVAPDPLAQLALEGYIARIGEPEQA